MTMAAWGMGYTAAWAAFGCAMPFWLSAPATLAIAGQRHLVGPDWAPFAIFLIAALALTVHTRLASLEARWEDTRTDYSDELGPTVLLVSALLITAWCFWHSSCRVPAATRWPGPFGRIGRRLGQR